MFKTEQMLLYHKHIGGTLTGIITPIQAAVHYSFSALCQVEYKLLGAELCDAARR